MLTRKQVELLEFIQARMAQDGVPPSFDEMKDALDLRSKSGIHRLVTALEERGFIRRLPHRARALEIVRLPDSMIARAAQRDAYAAHAAQPSSMDDAVKNDAATAQHERPAFRPDLISGGRHPRPRDARPVETAVRELAVMGRIAAGVPIEAISEVSHHIAVPGSMIAGRAHHYALEVKGDSMIEAGINDGDVVVIREQGIADNGDIIVALVDGHEATLKRYRRRGAMIALEAANPAYETRILPEDKVKVQGRLVGLIRSY